LSVAAPKNTLAYQLKGRPLIMKRDLSGVPIQSVAACIRQFHKQFGGNVAPETEAIMFYLANHAMKELAFKFDVLEPLPEWAVKVCDEYHRVSALISARAFYYMLMITAREARHNGTKHSSDWKQKVEKQFGKGPMMALLHYPDDNNVSTVTNVFDQYANGSSLGDVCRSIVYTHYEGSFHGGYGGPKWGNVSDCMTAFVTGQYTAEMMLDTVWTLVHNGGPIFNKGMLYDCYNTAALQQVLDIQRAGQIPRLVLAPHGNNLVAAEQYVKAGAKNFALQFIDNMGETADFRKEPVDFAQVQALGAVGSYGHLIKNLQQSPKQPAPYVPAVHGHQAQPEMTEKSHFIIAKSPGLYFKKLTRKELAA
jgi:hypothetical protein